MGRDGHRNDSALVGPAASEINTGPAILNAGRRRFNLKAGGYWVVADLKIERLPVSIESDTQSLKGNRRTQQRHRLANGFKVQLHMPPAEGIWKAELSDVSPGGAGFITRNEVLPGMIVMFSCGGQRIYARVQHCHGGAKGFRVGVRINDAVDELE